MKHKLHALWRQVVLAQVLWKPPSSFADTAGSRSRDRIPSFQLLFLGQIIHGVSYFSFVFGYRDCRMIYLYRTLFCCCGRYFSLALLETL